MSAQIGAVILAGGMSRRMGSDKALLELEGESFLGRIAVQLRDYPERLLSMNREDRFSLPEFLPVADERPDSGPLGGLYSALSACGSDWLLAVSCDMPLFSKGLGQYLTGQVSDGIDAVVTVTRDGRVHPLCAVYAKSAAPILRAQMEKGDLRMLDALAAMRVRRVELRHTVYSDHVVRNINTPEQYAALRRHLSGPPVVAVSGVKNSGKTTMLEGILPILRERGLRVAVIKHDGHDFDPDVPGTDSYRLRRAGARSVAVYSQHRYLITEERAGISVRRLLRRFRYADLVLLEGGKQSDYPKLEVVRAAVSQSPVSDHSTLLAVCTNVKGMDLGPIPVLDLEDYTGAAEAVLREWRRHQGEVTPRRDCPPGAEYCR